MGYRIQECTYKNNSPPQGFALGSPDPRTTEPTCPDLDITFLFNYFLTVLSGRHSENMFQSVAGYAVIINFMASNFYCNLSFTFLFQFNPFSEGKQFEWLLSLEFNACLEILK